ncbi:MAG: cytochrome c-type biogenesis protein CcmH [Proteobacteria bacterium]|nr:cytochrome c-type biogenesis protein CcmH [Pseudomonadota bacterium]
MKRSLLAAAIVLWATLALALAPSERLADPAQEARARELSAELRCLVCQNQSIDDSDADLAKDLRRLVRERIVAGDSNAEVKEFLVRRFGEFVLLKPSFSIRNALLWLLPLVVLMFGFVASRRLFARRTSGAGPAGAAPLTDAEQAEIDRLTNPHS